MILGAYFVGWVHNMLPWQYQDNGRILCLVGYAICYFDSILIMRAYCVGKIHNTLPW